MKPIEEMVKNMKEFLIEFDKILMRISNEHMEEFNSTFETGKYAIGFECTLSHEEPIKHVNYYLPILKIKCNTNLNEWQYFSGFMEYLWICSKLTEDEKNWLNENFKTFQPLFPPNMI